ncbi:MAG: response regulator, partial [Candidatus Eremiobacterota bacterium]
MRVLVVEDEPHMLEALAGVLEEEGYEVDRASRGAEAVARAAEVAYDLVVTDIRMEGMDGLEALEQMRRHQPEIRSLVVTGYSNEEDSIRAIRLGTGDWLKKPFHLSDFLARVNQVMASRHRELERDKAEEALRETAFWAVASLAASTAPQALAAGRVVYQLALRLGLAQPEQLAMAAMLAEMNGKIPPPMAETVGLSAERWDGSGPRGLRGEEIPLPARLLAAGRATVREEDLRSHDPLLAELAGRCDPAADFAPPAPDSHGARRRRGLLSLGRALEEASDLESATRSYELALGAEPTREGVQALLRLARLEVQRGQSGRALERCQEAARAARQLGPLAAGECLLEVGLLLDQPEAL